MHQRESKFIACDVAVCLLYFSLPFSLFVSFGFVCFCPPLFVFVCLFVLFWLLWLSLYIIPLHFLCLTSALILSPPHRIVWCESVDV